MLTSARVGLRSLQKGLRSVSNVVGNIHASQRAALGDSLIHVDENDQVLGSIPKLESHLADAINKGITHRAFSVFLFSADTHSLLIQKRCASKIVFPREWANTCCSHPLFTEAEMESVGGNEVGIKRAAVKRLGAELGISDLFPASLSFKEKILYRQLSPGGVFGESECDYILVGEVDAKAAIRPNPDEVESYEWIRPGPSGHRTSHLASFLAAEAAKGFPPTPWFNLMVRERECLETWWEGMIGDSVGFMRAENSRGGQIRNFLK